MHQTAEDLRGVCGYFSSTSLTNQLRKPTPSLCPPGQSTVTHGSSLRKGGLSGRETAKAWHKCWVKANENREGIQICVDECQLNPSLQIESSYH